MCKSLIVQPDGSCSRPCGLRRHLALGQVMTPVQECAQVGDGNNREASARGRKIAPVYRCDVFRAPSVLLHILRIDGLPINVPFWGGYRARYDCESTRLQNPLYRLYTGLNP